MIGKVARILSYSAGACLAASAGALCTTQEYCLIRGTVARSAKRIKEGKFPEFAASQMGHQLHSIFPEHWKGEKALLAANAIAEIGTAVFFLLGSYASAKSTLSCTKRAFVLTKRLSPRANAFIIKSLSNINKRNLITLFNACKAL